MGWHYVKTQNDIDYLMKEYNEFENSYMAGVNYAINCNIDQECMHFGRSYDRIACMFFCNQVTGLNIELCFNGVRVFKVAGWQKMYSCELPACYLKIINDLQPTTRMPLIVWSDDYFLDPHDELKGHMLDEPISSYIIAESLKWRFFENNSIR